MHLSRGINSCHILFSWINVCYLLGGVGSKREFGVKDVLVKGGVCVFFSIEYVFSIIPKVIVYATILYRYMWPFFLNVKGGKWEDVCFHQCQRGWFLEFFVIDFNTWGNFFKIFGNGCHWCQHLVRLLYVWHWMSLMSWLSFISTLGEIVALVVLLALVANTWGYCCDVNTWLYCWHWLSTLGNIVALLFFIGCNCWHLIQFGLSLMYDDVLLKFMVRCHALVDVK